MVLSEHQLNQPSPQAGWCAGREKVAVKDKMVHERLKEVQALLSKIHGLYDAHDWKAYEKKQVEGCVDALLFFWSGCCMAQQSSLSRRSLFCQLNIEKKNRSR